MSDPAASPTPPWEDLMGRMVSVTITLELPAPVENSRDMLEVAKQVREDVNGRYGATSVKRLVLAPRDLPDDGGKGWVEIGEPEWMVPNPW